MNRGIYKIIISILIVMELGFIFLSFKAYSNQTIEEIKKVNKVEKEQFSMYIEQEDGTYKREKKTNYLPASGYVLNNEKTFCEDTKGNEVADVLSFKEGKLTVTSSKTVYCTLYLDLKAKLCLLADDSTVESGLEGAKYNCKVDPNKPEYTFYLLNNNEDGTSDLIMNANINASGEAVIPGVTEDIGMVAWQSSGTNVDGPVTAMTYLHNATKSWTNVEPLNFQYYKLNSSDSPHKTYESFVSTNGIGVITKGDTDGTQVTIGTTSEPLRARMPVHSNDASISEVSEQTDVNSYLYDNFDQENYIYAPYGYWTLSAQESTDCAYYVCYDGSVYYDGVDGASDFGVRPVITVEL